MAVVITVRINDRMGSALSQSYRGSWLNEKAPDLCRVTLGQAPILNIPVQSQVTLNRSQLRLIDTKPRVPPSLSSY